MKKKIASNKLTFRKEKFGDDLKPLGINGDFVVEFRHISEEELDTLPTLPERDDEEFARVWKTYYTNLALMSIKKWSWDKPVNIENFKKLPAVVTAAIKANAFNYNIATEEDLKNLL